MTMNAVRQKDFRERKRPIDLLEEFEKFMIGL